MAKLIVTLDGQPITELELGKERVTIGRKPHNDIVIDNLAVSGEHVAVTTLHGQSYVEDLGSTNGTLVNDAPIGRAPLQHGDEIEIGKYRLRYANPEAIGARKEPADFNKPAIPDKPAIVPTQGGSDLGAHTISLAEHREPMAEPASQEAAPPAEIPPEPAKPEENRAAIQILNGPNAGKELDLNKTLTSLGKPGVQVAVITRRPHGYFVTHVQGDRRPAVNGQALDAHPRQLADHDVIELGGIKMEFYLR
ncbi:MAG: FHA domain-containing protein [Sulfuricella sp.]|nr:FHA domain-containing protein [Sulfuricella sp.]